MLRSLASVAVLAIMPLAPSLAATPPIDCHKAMHPAELEICASPAAVALDREIAALYDRGLAEFTPADRHALAQSQVRFVHARAGCAWAAHHSAHPGTAVGECVQNKMEERVRWLRHTIDTGGYGR